MGREKLGAVGAAMILSTYSTTSSNIMFPHVYGTLGVVLGPLLGVVLQGFMCLLAIEVMKISVAAKCKNFGESGAYTSPRG